jgi:subtilisin family serine protease
MRLQRFERAMSRLLAGLVLLCAAGCTHLPALLPTLLPVATQNSSAASISGDDLIVVAVADKPEARAAAGSAPRAAYVRAAGYAGSDQALALADQVASAMGLSELKAWTIPSLNWRCMLYRLPAGLAREQALARLAANPLVQLAQPLNNFETLADVPSTGAAYNDPYLRLQQGFVTIDAASAQRVTRGEGIQVAVIDTAIEASHPDLQGRISASRDFVGRAPTSERHGTEVAGIIAATANNGIGIVGVAPGARLVSLRACWAVPESAAARCNSFTLALALSAAIAADVDIINLSLGGPPDPLLEKLLQQALARGIVVVGALPPSGRRDGFPTNVPGVLAVAASEDGPPAAGLLAAPGRRILTLAPGGSYDYASGSSLASGHVSGTVALLRAVDRRLDGAALSRLLGAGLNAANPSIDACRALQRLESRVPPVCAATR